MSPLVSAVPGQPNNIIRHSADYEPSLWGDHFLTCHSQFTKLDTATKQQYEELKEEVRRMILANNANSAKYLSLIDAVQRLGVGYHFEREIDDALERLHHDDYNGRDLYTTALRFRLLRQQGVKVSCNVFQKLEDENGKFKASITEDVRGMLSLYEAAHLSIHGEDILDEALAFTTTHLKEIVSDQVSPQLFEQVKRALYLPIRKNLPRLEARQYIPIYASDDTHEKILLEFAKLDFNILQAQHQKELSDLMKWWKEIDVKKNFPFARDRMVEIYFWMVGVYFEPKYALARSIFGKLLILTVIVDDSYDAYGTYDELKPFTEAFERWDISEADTLPADYLKLIYKKILETFDEIEENLAKEGRSYAVHYAKKEWKKLVRGYLVELNWFTKNYVPTMEEYLPIALVTGTYQWCITVSFLGMGEIATKEAFEWASNVPKMVRAASVICRLVDDITSHEFEQKRGHVASGIECYTKQHGVSEEEVTKIFKKEAADAWKDMNEECLKPTAVPMPLLERILNLVRDIDVIHKDADMFTHAHLLKDTVAIVLKDPV